MSRLRTGHSRTALADIYNWFFTEAFDTAVLNYAKALLEELSTSH